MVFKTNTFFWQGIRQLKAIDNVKMFNTYVPHDGVPIVQGTRYLELLPGDSWYVHFASLFYVGVLDTGVSRSTCSWAPSITQLRPRGEMTTTAQRRRPSWGGASWGERRLKPLRTRRPPHEMFLMRGRTTSMSARYVSVLSKKIRAEDCVPSTLPR
jgi:hypothetical protein